LLDTHIWLWSQGSPAQLVPRIRAELANPRNELWLSPLSIWEVLLLSDKKRIILDEPAERWVVHALDNSPFKEASLSNEVALETANVKLEHRDPVDRFLAATARVFELILVTADKRLLNGKGFSKLANQ
jgi:PIN domain nuclease of toxin-antitoxin system